MTDFLSSPATKIEKSKDNWDKADIVGKLLGAVLIPLVIAVAGYLANEALQERAAKQKTVDVAIAILKSKEVNAPYLKTWAEAVFTNLARESGTALTEQAKSELKTLPLPSASYPPLVVPASDPGKIIVCNYDPGTGRYDQCSAKPVN